MVLRTEVAWTERNCKQASVCSNSSPLRVVDVDAVYSFIWIKINTAAVMDVVPITSVDELSENAAWESQLVKKKQINWQTNRPVSLDYRRPIKRIRVWLRNKCVCICSTRFSPLELEETSEESRNIESIEHFRNELGQKCSPLFLTKQLASVKNGFSPADSTLRLPDKG